MRRSSTNMDAFPESCLSGAAAWIIHGLSRSAAGMGRRLMRDPAGASNKPLKLGWWVPQHTDSWMSRLHLDPFFFFPVFFVFFLVTPYPPPSLFYFRSPTVTIHSGLARDGDANERSLARRRLTNLFEPPGSRRRPRADAMFFGGKNCLEASFVLSLCHSNMAPHTSYCHFLFSLFLMHPGSFVPSFHPSLSTTPLLLLRMLWFRACLPLGSVNIVL